VLRGGGWEMVKWSNGQMSHFYLAIWSFGHLSNPSPAPPRQTVLGEGLRWGTILRA